MSERGCSTRDESGPEGRISTVSDATLRPVPTTSRTTLAPSSAAPTSSRPGHAPSRATGPSAPTSGAVARAARTNGPAQAPRTVATRAAGVLLTLLLGGLTAVPALSMDMYLPALPGVTRSLHAPAASVQLTITTCLAGMALGQLIVGPMSDRWGRRRPLLVGMFVYVVATAACVFAPNVELLIGFRLAQGLAGAAGIVIARAVVRDLYDGVEMARFFSTLMLISGVAPIVAPLIGGQVLRVTDWRGVFGILTVVGTLITVFVWFRLPDTLDAGKRHAGGLGDTLRAMRGLLADGPFSGYMLAGGFAFAELFTYVSASPYVIQEIYGASPQTFSLLFGINSVGLVAAGQINGKILVGRVSLDRTLAVGLVTINLAAVALLLMTSGFFGAVGLVPVAATLFVLMTAMGVTLPNTNALALMRTPHAAGSGSALLGSTQFLIGAAASPLAGIAGEHTAVPMAVVQLASALLAAACFVGLCRPWRRDVGEHGGRERIVTEGNVAGRRTAPSSASGAPDPSASRVPRVAPLAATEAD
jgi:MFS transporter, DHA1 family, multidrug resistance protein